MKDNFYLESGAYLELSQTFIMESFLQKYLKAKLRLYKKHKTGLIPVKDCRKHRIQLSSFAYVMFNKSRFEGKTSKIFR